jgi:hypothetical protein
MASDGPFDCNHQRWKHQSAAARRRPRSDLPNRPESIRPLRSERTSEINAKEARAPQNSDDWVSRHSVRVLGVGT